MTIASMALLVLGGALAVEGFGWAVAPDGMRDAYRALVERLDKRQLGLIGLLSLCSGLACIVLAVALLR